MSNKEMIQLNLKSLKNQLSLLKEQKEEIVSMIKLIESKISEIEDMTKVMKDVEQSYMTEDLDYKN